MDALQAVFESVARYFSVLGEPARVRILHALCQQERCVSELLKVTGLAQANASRHLGLMYQAGVLSRRRDGNQMFYRVADPMYVELCRAVSAQIAGRCTATAGESPTRFHNGTGVLPDAPGPNAPTHPANQKEKESV